jgi:hypothetical protein
MKSSQLWVRLVPDVDAMGPSRRTVTTSESCVAPYGWTHHLHRHCAIRWCVERSGSARVSRARARSGPIAKHVLGPGLQSVVNDPKYALPAARYGHELMQQDSGSLPFQ